MLKTVQWNVIIIVVVVVDDNSLLLGSVNPFQVYYKVRQLLLQSVTGVITKCDSTVKIRDLYGNSGKGFKKIDTR